MTPAPATGRSIDWKAFSAAFISRWFGGMALGAVGTGSAASRR